MSCRDDKDEQVEMENAGIKRGEWIWVVVVCRLGLREDLASLLAWLVAAAAARQGRE